MLKNVIHSDALPLKVKELEKNFNEDLLSKKELNKISQKLIKMHVPNNPDILSLFQINKDDIIQGIYCKKCAKFTVVRVWGAWQCHICKKIYPNAHLSALEDYVLLFGPDITNQQLRTFLNIKSESVARKILTSVCKESFGQNKNRTYKIPFRFK